MTVKGRSPRLPRSSALPQLKDYVKEGSSISVSIGDYFSTMLDESMNWQNAEDVRKKWGKQFCLKAS
jgi:L-lactate dehydrogenase (cytochrome)